MKVPVPMGRRSLSRRAALRGLGAAVALPWLDAMTPAFGRAASTRPPPRLAFLCVPNGAHMPEWTPARTGADFALPPVLEPLKNVRDRLLVLTGLAQDNARAHGDGPGDHARSLAAFLTAAHPVKTDGANIRAGVSVDQVAAQRVGHATRLPSLELGIQAGAQSGACDSGYSCAYSSNLSWKTESLPLAKDTDPAAVFDRLFGYGIDPQRDREEHSILDFVRQDLETLQPKLGRTDNRKVDEYLTGVRELERRIARFAEMPPRQGPAFSRPESSPRENQEHIRLMCDLLVVAFQADVTRIATFLVANEGSNKSYPQLEISEGHHELSHHGRNPEKLVKIARINRYHTSQLAYLLEKMASVEEGEGTLLDHAMVLYGSGIGDGDQHNHDDLPILVAGGGGGTLKTGRHLKFSQTPLANLFLCLLDRMNASVDRFGDSTGRLTGLEG